MSGRFARKHDARSGRLDLEAVDRPCAGRGLKFIDKVPLGDRECVVRSSRRIEHLDLDCDVAALADRLGHESNRIRPRSRHRLKERERSAIPREYRSLGAPVRIRGDQFAHIDDSRLEPAQFWLWHVLAFEFRKIVRAGSAVRVFDAKYALHAARHDPAPRHRSEAHWRRLRRTGQRAVRERQVVHVALDAAVVQHDGRTALGHPNRVETAAFEPDLHSVVFEIGDLERTGPVVPDFAALERDASLYRRAVAPGEDRPDAALGVVEEPAVAVRHVHRPAVLP